MFEVFAEYLLGDHLAGLTFDPPEGEQYYPRLVSPHGGPTPPATAMSACWSIPTRTGRASSRRSGGQELLSDPRFATHGKRAGNIDKVYAFVAERSEDHAAARNGSRCSRGRIPVMPLNDIAVTARRSASERCRILQVRRTSNRRPAADDAGARHLVGIGSRRCAACRPISGEHTEEVLREIGIPADEIGGSNSAALEPAIPPDGV